MNKVILIKLPGAEGKDIDGATDFIQSLLDQANQADGANELEENPQMEMDFGSEDPDPESTGEDTVAIRLDTGYIAEVPLTIAHHIFDLEKAVKSKVSMTKGEMIEELSKEEGINFTVIGGRS